MADDAAWAVWKFIEGRDRVLFDRLNQGIHTQPGHGVIQTGSHNLNRIGLKGILGIMGSQVLSQGHHGPVVIGPTMLGKKNIHATASTVASRFHRGILIESTAGEIPVLNVLAGILVAVFLLAVLYQHLTA
jgi:hypothetical protein